MGWAYGELPSGKKVGYSVLAKCEHPGCEKEIDRGLSYACGDMHGMDEISCDGYFCETHLFMCTRWDSGDLISLCAVCDADNEKAIEETAAELGLTIDDYVEKIEDQAKDARDA